MPLDIDSIKKVMGIKVVRRESKDYIDFQLRYRTNSGQNNANGQEYLEPGQIDSIAAIINQLYSGKLLDEDVYCDIINLFSEFKNRRYSSLYYTHSKV